MELKPQMFKKILPIPVTVITSVDREGRVNAAPYGCVMPILRPLDLITIASACKPPGTIRLGSMSWRRWAWNPCRPGRWSPHG